MKLSDTFSVIKPDLSVDTVPVTPSLYPDLDTNYAGFKGHLLVSEYEFSEDWPTWERHPAGDETVVLLSGRATMILREDEVDRLVSLSQPGEYLVVPRNTWHTARVAERARMLFITPEEGTENKAEI